MTPIKFPESNRTLGGDGYRSESVLSIEALPIWSDGEQCVSCWKMSWRERLSAMLSGRIWVQVLSGSNQPPVALSMSRTIFERKEHR